MTDSLAKRLAACAESHPWPFPQRDEPEAEAPTDAKPSEQHSEMDILHLAELVPIVRERLSIDENFPDDSILASLKSITAKSAARDRWQTAFSSNLGSWLTLKGEDAENALNTLVTLLPPPRS